MICSARPPRRSSRRVFRLALKLDFLHPLVLQLERVVHLLARELLASSWSIPRRYSAGRSTLPTNTSFSTEIPSPARRDFNLLDHLLDLGRFGGEDLAALCSREDLVDGAGNGGLDDVRVHVRRQVVGHLARFAGSIA